ncbi:MAG: DUF4382 domain-containing protein [Proteiniphilum sp.]|jgi:hypothetical protein|nr:DUF4382 domain-containing protein [Proteiniphilum sp.]
MPIKLIRYILPALLILTVESCSGDDPSVNASRLRLKLTDAPSTVIKEFHADIREISVFLTDTTGQSGEWHPLRFSGKKYDILKLRNGRTVQIVDQYIPAGTELRQIRLKFGNESYLKTNTDSTIPLHIPPALQDGAVIDAVKMELRLNTISSMIIDLNAAHSVWKDANGNNYLYPAARAFPETHGGKLRGYVAPLEANPLVALIQAGDTLFATPEKETTDAQMAMFQFIGLQEGEWKVYMKAEPGSGYRDTVITTSVETGKTVEMTPKPMRLRLVTE